SRQVADNHGNSDPRVGFWRLRKQGASHHDAPTQNDARHPSCSSHNTLHRGGRRWLWKTATVRAFFEGGGWAVFVCFDERPHQGTAFRKRICRHPKNTI